MRLDLSMKVAFMLASATGTTISLQKRHSKFIADTRNFMNYLWEIGTILVKRSWRKWKAADYSSMQTPSKQKKMDRAYIGNQFSMHSRVQTLSELFWKRYFIQVNKNT